MAGVFISYRREDGGIVAPDIVRELEASVDAEIFYDLRSIRPGEAFREIIDQALQHCSVVLALLGKDWAGLDPSGTRRIESDDDIFRQELEAALSSTAYIIPVLIGSTFTLRAEDLPISLQRVASLQWHKIRPETKEDDVRGLADLVRTALERQRFRRIHGDDSPDHVITAYKPILPLTQDPPSSKRKGAGFHPEPLILEGNLAFRINVAIATGRVLIVSGAERSGHDALAQSIAWRLGWSCFEFEFTATSTPKSLLYSVDETRRLADAQIGQLRTSLQEYIEPGPLWWAMDPQGAIHLRRSQGATVDMAGYETNAAGAVLSLVGDPPKNLRDYLRPIGSQRFIVPETADVVTERIKPLVVLTVSSPRAVDAWMRHRAVICYVPLPSIQELVRIARSYNPDLEPELIERIAQELLEVRSRHGRDSALTASQLLDVVHATATLRIDAGSTEWRALLDALGLFE